MAKSDVLVRMKADVSGYDANIAKARKTLENFKQDNLSLGGILAQTTKSLTAAAAGFASVAAAGAAISSLVSESIELAQAGEGIRLAFERLDRPDLLDNLRQATHNTVSDIELMKQAVKFDNFNLSLDDMGTMLAFAQQKAKDTGESIDYMVDSITTGLGRQSKQILDNLGISAAELTKRMNEGKDMTQAVADIIREEMAKAGDYVETAGDRAAQANVRLQNAMEELGQTLAPLTDAGQGLFNTWKVAAIDFLNSAMKPLLQAFTQFGAIQKIQDNINGGGFLGRVTGNLRNSNNKESLYSQQLMEINKTINKARTNLQNAEKGGMGGIEIYRNRLKALENIRDQYIAAAQQIMSPAASTTSTSTTKSGKSKTKTIDAAGDWNKALRKGMDDTDSLKKALDLISPFAMLTDEAKKQMLGLNEATRDWGGAMAEIGNQEVLDEIGAATKRIEQQQKAMDLAAQSAANFGAALAGIGDPGMKAAGTVMAAIANIALGFAQAAAAKDTVGSGWAWLAWVAAGTAAMATAISTVHSLTGYAQGGIVDGNSYSGDNIPIMANAGELVLTKAAQASLANHLEGGGMSGLGPSRISGEQIYITLNRYLKRSGQGELMTWG